MSRESEQGVSLEILNVKSDKANLGGGGLGGGYGGFLSY